MNIDNNVDRLTLANTLRKVALGCPNPYVSLQDMNRLQIAAQWLLDDGAYRSKRAPRVLCLAEVLVTSGAGWYEDYVSVDDGSEKNYIEKCVWLGGIVHIKHSAITRDMLITLYNLRKNGFRIWAGDYPPSDEQRKAAAWYG